MIGVRITRGFDINRSSIDRSKRGFMFEMNEKSGRCRYRGE